MLEWIEPLVLDKEIIVFGMDESFHDFGYKTCETDRLIVAGRVFVPFLTDWCNIRSCPVSGREPVLIDRLKRRASGSAIHGEASFRSLPGTLVWSGPQDVS